MNLYAHLAELCGLAQLPPEKMLQKVRSQGYTPHFLTADEADAYYLERPALPSVLVFRGTEWEWKDWTRNLRVRKAPHLSGGWVHKGFLNGWQALQDQVFAILKQHHFSSSRLYVTGHSQGGALAVLAVWDLLAQHIVQVRELVTFGTPRVGDKRFAERYPPICGKRIVHRGDSITMIPIWGYRHVWKAKKVGVPIPMISEHSIHRYVKALSA